MLFTKIPIIIGKSLFFFAYKENSCIFAKVNNVKLNKRCSCNSSPP